MDIGHKKASQNDKITINLRRSPIPRKTKTGSISRGGEGRVVVVKGGGGVVVNWGLLFASPLQAPGQLGVRGLLFNYVAKRLP